MKRRYVRRTQRAIRLPVAFFTAMFLLGATLGQAHALEEAPVRDGFVVQDAIADSSERIILAGYGLFEESEVANSADKNLESKLSAGVYRTGQIVTLAPDYNVTCITSMGHQSNFENYSSSSVKRVWPFDDDKALALFDYDDNRTLSFYGTVNGPTVEPIDALFALEPGRAFTMNKVKDGYVFGGHRTNGETSAFLRDGDEISFYNDNLALMWTLKDKVLVGCRFAKAASYNEGLLFYGDRCTETEDGATIPAVLSLSQDGTVNWIYSDQELLGGTVEAVHTSNDDEIAIIIGMSDPTGAEHEKEKIGMLQIVNGKGECEQKIDLFKEHDVYNPTSIAHVSDQYIVLGSYKNDNAGKLLYFAKNGEFIKSTDLILDPNCIKQNAFLVQSPSGIVHVYGSLQYDDELANSDRTKEYQSFVQLIHGKATELKE